MKAYGHAAGGRPGLARARARFAASVRDVSEFLAAEPLPRPLRE